MSLLRRVPVLLLASSITFGGFIPFWDAEYAIRLFGLPGRIAVSPTAQSVMILSSARISAIGMAIFIFMYQRKYAAVDTMLSVIGYIGLVDGYVCWMEGVPNKAVFRCAASLLAAAWGWFGLTTGD